MTADGMLIRGRFDTSLSEVMEKINASIPFDREMYAQDIEASRAHARMLVAQKIISQDDGARIDNGLVQIRSEIEAGTFTFSTALEDIHMNVEARLTEIIGPAAGRLHTARSRNDQVATDFKLWMREAHDHAIALVRDLIVALLDQAEANAGTIMPGFTHLQGAQPVTFGHHMMAYVEMFGRDLERLEEARKRCNQSPLGAAALAGTSFPIDRAQTAAALGFDAPMRNSLDAVSDRDFAIEFMSVASLSMVHLSRLSEEVVFWMSAHFQFVTMSDAWTTGSSIMPQKRNPDAAELIRGKTGRVTGTLNGLLMLMKGLPLTFSKDMQEDKLQSFQATEEFLLCLRAMAGMVRDMQPRKEQMHAAASLGHATATDLADWLVRVLDLPFREAHHIVGSLVKRADALSVSLEDVPLAEFQAVHPDITADVYSVLGVRASVDSRVSYGGTAPQNVARAVAEWREVVAGWRTDT